MPSRKNAPEWFGGNTTSKSSMSSSKSKSKSKSKSSSRSSGGSSSNSNSNGNGSSGKRSHRRSTSLDSAGLDLSNHSSSSRRGDKKSSSSRKKNSRKKSLDLNDSTSTHSGASSSRHHLNGNGSKHSIDSKIMPMPLDQQEPQTQQQTQTQKQKQKQPLKITQKVEGKIQTDGSYEQQPQDGGVKKVAERRPSFVERIFGIKSSQKSEATSTPAGNSIAPEEQKLLPDNKNSVSGSNSNEHGAYVNEHLHRDVHNNNNNNNLGIMSLHQQMSQTLPTKGGQQMHLATSHGDTSMRIPQEPFHNNPLQYQQQHQHPYPYDHSQPYYQKYQSHHNGMDQNVYRKQPFPTSKEPYIQHSATYPAPRNAFDNHNGGAFHSGTESDDLFMYSEDESMTTPMPSNYPMQFGMNVNPFPYGSYSYEGYQNRESFEVREHQQMMALAPSNRHITSFAPASIGAGSGESKYGSITDSMHTHSPNDMYISEDETLMSESSKMNSVGGYRRSSVSSLDGLGGFPSGIFDSTNNMVIEEGDEEEGDEAEAKTNDGHGVSSLISQTPVDHLRHSEEIAPVANVSNSKRLSRTYSNETDAKSSNSGSAGGGGSSNHSGGSKARSVTIKAMPSNYSSGSSTGSGAGAGKRARRNSHKKQKSPTPKRQSPPPPVTSVKVHKIHNRNFSSETNTTGSTSIPSPAQTAPPPKLSRKEYKRLTKRLEAAELREDRVQQIIRSGHEDALEWSMHVPQHIRGMSRAAGFFPNEEIKLHDIPFAILFLVQLGVVISLAVSYANETVMNGSTTSSMSPGYDEPFGINSYSDDPFGAPLENWAKDIHVDYKNAFNLSCITALYATSLSALSIGMMMILGKALIPTVLCLGVIICIGFATIGSVLTPYSCIPIVGLLALIFSLGYSVVVWERIPFASTNLNTALCGVKSSADVLLVAFVMMIMAFMWTIGWAIAFLGVYDHYLDKNSESGVNNSITWVGICIYVGMCISYFWTMNVMNNVVHVTVAGVVATWWADPDSLSTCCNSVLRELFTRSLTTSFGSICLGSLVVPPLHFLKMTCSFCCDFYAPPSRSPEMVDLSNHSKYGEYKFSDCVSEASSPITNLPVPKSPFDGIIRYYNDYGFTYVGIYREGFKTSSRKATDVFKAREWVGVSSDNLVPHVLALISVFITLGSGCFGLVVEEFDGYSFTNFQKPTSTAFSIGCWIGFVISRILFKLVGSAVNTVLVCFSLAPWTFKVNHPVLSHEMRSSWGGTWLDEHEWLHNLENGEAKPNYIPR